MDKRWSKGNVSVSIFLDPQVRQKGDHSVRFRIIHNREIYNFTPGFNLSKADFKRLASAYLKNTELKTTQEQIETAFDHITGTIDDILKNGEYSTEKLKTLLKKGKFTNVLKYMDSMILNFEISGRIGNASVYKAARTFLKKHLGENIPFKKITPKVLEAIGDKAISDGIRQTSLSIYLRTVRAVYKNAITANIIEQSLYPFTQNEGVDKKYQIREGEGTHNALTVYQLSQIVRMDFSPHTPALRRSRDLFLLMYHMGGINIGDLLCLKWKDIKNGEIEYVRKKTKSTTKKEIKIHIPVTDSINKYFDLYGTLDRNPDDFILPFMQRAKNDTDIKRITKNYTRIINKHLAKISKELKLPTVSTYVARHSFATITKNSGVSESFIKEALGHSSLATTQNYLKNFEREQRKEIFKANELLINQ
ncbi:MAG: tyrosine-type recombinase/integrase [Candidatus Saccharimonadaceae bacterium]